MEIRKFTRSLTGQIFRLLIGGVLVWLYLFTLTYMGGSNIIKHCWRAYAESASESEFAVQELQRYVEENQLAATDINGLSAWRQTHSSVVWRVVRNHSVLFSSYWETNLLSDRQKEGAYSRSTCYTVTFAGGEAKVYIYDILPGICFSVLRTLSLLAGGAACFGIVWAGLRKKIRYIRYLETEVDAIGGGQLQDAVHIQGVDELAQLASGVDRMRRTLLADRQREEELQAAQEKLVLGMSHDLRTPLTGLMTYVELLRRSLTEEDGSRKYLAKIYEKIFQIRDLSDRMFGYILIHSSEPVSLEPPEDIARALEDSLSELCVTLESEGFPVNAGNLTWRPAKIRVSTDYLGRILNNLISNLLKYGDRNREVTMELLYAPTEIGVQITNTIREAKTDTAGTGLGLQNISAMMERMGGRLCHQRVHEFFQVTLYFPIVNDSGKPSV